MAEPDPQWLERLRAVGKAQARYLWILSVAMVFYAALQSGIGSSPGDPALKVPIVELPVSGAVVLASGTPVLSFIVLAILGSGRALRQARVALGLRGHADWSGEEFDTSPNAIDLAFYTTPQSHKIIATVAHFGYAVFLLLGVVEAGWLWWRPVAARSAAWWWVPAMIGAVLWLPTAWRVFTLWVQRIRNVPTLWRTV